MRTEKTLVNGVELTERQMEIISMIEEQYCSTGTGVGFAEICEKFGFASKNALNVHIEKILKSGKIICEVDENGRLRSNSLRPAEMAGVVRTTTAKKSDTCRCGNGYCVAILNSENVLFTLFNGVEILENGIRSISDVIGFCDNFKIPADLAVIDRIEVLAEKRAAKLAALRAAKPAEVTIPAEPVKKTSKRSKK